MPLPTGITLATPQNDPSADHADAHNKVHDIINKAFPSGSLVGGPDPLSTLDALMFQINHWNGSTPIGTPGATAKITRREKFTVANPNPVSSVYNAALLLEDESEIGNLQQVVALGINVVGDAGPGLFVLGSDTQIRHYTGAGGGAMGHYVNSIGYVDDATINGVGLDAYNETRHNGVSSVGNQAVVDVSVGGSGTIRSAVTCTSASPGVVTWTAHGLNTYSVIYFISGTPPTGTALNTPYWITVIDANTFKLSTSYANAVAGTFVNTSSTGSGLTAAFFARFGTAFQARNNAGAQGGDSVVYAFGSWQAGVNFTGANILTGSYFLADATFGMVKLFANSTPAIVYDNNDYVSYDRSGNVWNWVVAGVPHLVLGNGVYYMGSLPNSSPGAGTKKLYYDASGFVKYAF